MKIKDFKIGQKIIAGFVILLIFCALIGYVGFSKMAIVTDRVDKSDDANRLVKYALEIRFLLHEVELHSEIQAAVKWENLINEIFTQIDSTKAKFKQKKNRELMDELKSDATQYNISFVEYLQLTTQLEKLDDKMVETGRMVIGSTDPNSIYYGGAKLAGASGIVEAILNARRHEKNFIIREDNIYIDKIHNELDFILSSTENAEIVLSANNYRKDINNYINIHSKKKIIEEGMHNLADRLIENAIELRSIQKDQMLDAKNSANLMIILFTFVAVIIGIFIGLTITKLIRDPLNVIVKSIKAISRGDLEQQVDIDSNDEIGVLADSYRNLQNSLLEITEKAKVVASGNLDVHANVRSEKDELAISINEMTKSLRETSAKNERQNWLKTGQNNLNEKMSGDQDVVSLSRTIITFLAKYLNSQIGTIYLVEEDNENLKLTGSYAFSKRKNMNQNIKFGEGLVGQSA